MVSNTRRRALGLLLAAAAALRFPDLPRALAAKKKDCFESKSFGPWKAQATDAQAGARINEVSFVDAEACDLRIEVQVAASFEGKIVVYGDPDETPLPKKFLIEPGNRLIVRTEDGTRRRRRAAMRQLRRYFRRQGLNRVAVGLRAPVPRGEVDRDGGQARRQGGLPLQARLRDLAHRAGLGV